MPKCTICGAAGGQSSTSPDAELPLEVDKEASWRADPNCVNSFFLPFFFVFTIWNFLLLLFMLCHRLSV